MWLPDLPPTSSSAMRKDSAKVDADERTAVEPKENDDEVAYGSAPAISVYVKNLNFNTTDSSLRSGLLAALEKRPKVQAALRTAVVSTRRDPRNPDGRRLSDGYGFLEFSSPDMAAKAVKLAQGTVVDGFALELKLSSKGKDEEKAEKASKKRAKNTKVSSKLAIRNVAFDASVKNIQALNAAFWTGEKCTDAMQI